MNEADLQPNEGNAKLDKVKNTLVNFVVPIVAVSLIAIMFFTMILPSVRATPELQIELEEKKTLNNILSTKVTTLNKLVDFSDIVSENSALIDRLIVSDAAPLALQDQVYQIAVSSGLEVTKLTYSSGGKGVTTEGTHNSVAVSLGSTGVYEQLITFMELVENAARFLSVEGLRFSSSDKDGNVVLVADMSLESPYMEIDSQAVTDDPIGLNISSDEFVEFMNKIKALQYYEFSADSPNIPDDIIEPPTDTESPSDAPVVDDNPGLPVVTE